MLNEQEMERSKELLDEFYELKSKIDTMAAADALEEMKLIAENMVDFITDMRYPE